MSGLQLVEEVMRARPDVRVLFTSGYPSWAGKLLVEFGPEGPLLQKPYKKKQLAEKVREVLDAPAAELPTAIATPIGSEVR
jgi:ActR/RegA family two-component response regulator